MPRGHKPLINVPAWCYKCLDVYDNCLAPKKLVKKFGIERLTSYMGRKCKRHLKYRTVVDQIDGSTFYIIEVEDNKNVQSKS